MVLVLYLYFGRKKYAFWKEKYRRQLKVSPNLAEMPMVGYFGYP